MTGAEIWGVIRTILAAFAGWVAAKGWIDAETYNTIIGAIGTIFVAIWSVWAKKSLVASNTPPK